MSKKLQNLIYTFHFPYYGNKFKEVQLEKLFIIFYKHQGLIFDKLLYELLF